MITKSSREAGIAWPSNPETRRHKENMFVLGSPRQCFSPGSPAFLLHQRQDFELIRSEYSYNEYYFNSVNAI